jgi:hypothetical protein
MPTITRVDVQCTLQRTDGTVTDSTGRWYVFICITLLVNTPEVYVWPSFAADLQTSFASLYATVSARALQCKPLTGKVSATSQKIINWNPDKYIEKFL